MVLLFYLCICILLEEKISTNSLCHCCFKYDSENFSHRKLICLFLEALSICHQFLLQFYTQPHNPNLTCTLPFILLSLMPYFHAKRKVSFCLCLTQHLIIFPQYFCTVLQETPRLQWFLDHCHNAPQSNPKLLLYLTVDHEQTIEYAYEAHCWLNLLVLFWKEVQMGEETGRQYQWKQNE